MKFIVNIDVDDLERGVEFYEKGLGFALARRLFEGTVAEMTGGHSIVYLVEKPAGSAIMSEALIYRDYTVIGRLFTWIFRWTTYILQSNGHWPRARSRKGKYNHPLGVVLQP